MLTWRWDRDDDDVDDDVDDSHASVEEFENDGSAKKDDPHLQRNAQTALSHQCQDSMSTLLDASRSDVSDRFIDQGFCKNARSAQMTHLGLGDEESSRGRSSGGGSEMGWERVELWGGERKQIGRTDERWSSKHHSHTVAFRRVSD